MSVISGEGVKPYYRRFGFYDGEHFLLKDLSIENTHAYDADFSIDQIIYKVYRFGNKDEHKHKSLIACDMKMIRQLTSNRAHNRVIMHVIRIAMIMTIFVAFAIQFVF
jgi:hypothetical protein